MIFLDDKPKLLKIIKRYINGDISKVPEFYEDIKVIFAFKRECSKIKNSHKCNLIVAKNMMITILNCFPYDYRDLFKEIFKGQYEDIINTFLYNLSVRKSLINMNKELLEELNNVVYK
jgi:hypothetical protein